MCLGVQCCPGRSNRFLSVLLAVENVAVQFPLQETSSVLAMRVRLALVRWTLDCSTLARSTEVFGQLPYRYALAPAGLASDRCPSAAEQSDRCFLESAFVCRANRRLCLRECPMESSRFEPTGRYFSSSPATPASNFWEAPFVRWCFDQALAQSFRQASDCRLLKVWGVPSWMGCSRCFFVLSRSQVCCLEFHPAELAGCPEGCSDEAAELLNRFPVRDRCLNGHSVHPARAPSVRQFVAEPCGRVLLLA